MAIWPRRSGKDVCAWNICIRELILKTQAIYYVFPTYSSGRRILWDAIDNDGFRILDYLPKELIESKNEQLMRIKLKNGSLFQVIGSDNYDNALIGTNPKGIVFSEFAISNPMAYSFVRPILSANGGWVLFVSTPRGKNFLWELYNVALNHKDSWFVSKLTVDDTLHIPFEEIERERIEGEMSEDLQLQEYWTSFDKGVEGSYYAKYLDKLRFNGQIGNIPWEPALPVHTAWDIGYSDHTSIIFFQIAGQVIRIIDFYENNKIGLEHYAKVLHAKEYMYGKHVTGDDIAVHDLVSGISRWRKMKELGVTFLLRKKGSKCVGLMDGIEAVRAKLPLMWFDQDKCAPLIKALENYRQMFDHKLKVYKDKPLHDINSHAADAMRYLCVNLHKFRQGLTPDELDRRYKEAMYGDNHTLPPVFRDDLPIR